MAPDVRRKMLEKRPKEAKQCDSKGVGHWRP